MVKFNYFELYNLIPTSFNSTSALSDLSVDGYDLIRLGLAGKEIRDALKFLLELVIDDRIHNNKEKMLELISRKKLKIARE